MSQFASDAADYRLMARALQLARKGLNTTTPNPRVGCVLARDDSIIAEGWHERAGGPHAEIVALRAARLSGIDPRGTTAYVTLEPCAHFGRTPPCADALIEAGIGRVVVAMVDPNPQVAGRGLTRLQSVGMTTSRGVLEAEAQELNIGFISRMTRGRPWVRLKAAISLDGKTALNNGRSQWITSPEARRDAHAWRARSCAMLTGIGTVRDDNPQLTVRDIETSRQPARVVVDSRLETPATSRVLGEGGCLIFAAIEPADRRAALEARGAEIVCLPDTNGKVDLPAMFLELGRRGMNEVLVEAGTRLNGALIQAACIDELLIYQAPILLGDKARGLADLAELTEMSGRRALRLIDSVKVGHDVRLRGRWEQDEQPPIR